MPIYIFFKKTFILIAFNSFIMHIIFIKNLEAFTLLTPTNNVLDKVIKHTHNNLDNNYLATNPTTIVNFFPDLAERAYQQNTSIHTIVLTIIEQMKNQNNLHLSWGDTLNQNFYISYILHYLNNIIAEKETYNSIIHTTAGEIGSMPIYLISQTLLALGFNTITINTISTQIKPQEIFAIKKNIGKKLLKNQRYLLTQYLSEKEYINAIEKRFAQKSNSYHLSLPTQKTTSFTHEVAANNHELYKTINEIALNINENEEIRIKLHYQQPTTINIHGNSSETQKIALTIKKIVEKYTIPTTMETIKNSTKLVTKLKSSQKKNYPNKKNLLEELITTSEQLEVSTLLINNHDRLAYERFHTMIAQTTKTKKPIVYILENSMFKKHEALYY